MDYNHREIEKFWQNYWQTEKTYKTEIDISKPKYYVLDMFPYPSGAGLHVGHPLGYIASDIYTRYKRHKGYNVLHPMGYDSFGLPAEQYAIQTGQHPSITTIANINRYREQLDKIGFSFDWDREIRTSEPNYYKWTQWIFKQLYNHYYDDKENKALPISHLIEFFNKENYQGWKTKTDSEKEELLSKYRLTYLCETEVNWCPALGTVLANDEVKEGLSERGGFAVERKKMLGWQMRITSYAERLLEGLDSLDWSDSIKESQRYWIGRSKGAYIDFQVEDSDNVIKVFTTRADTIFGVSFLTLAPEHDIVKDISSKNKLEVQDYVNKTKKRSERERQADAKIVSGCFTGSYAFHPLTGEKIPIYISDYVLSSYGTGAVMAVPSGDDRDYLFAKHFSLPITPILKDKDISEKAYTEKNGIYLHDFIKGLNYEQALDKILKELEEKNVGKTAINYRLRDAVFSRQRYWGEPIPVSYNEKGEVFLIPDQELPVILPEVDKFLPTETGEPPLGRAKGFKSKQGYKMELNTMPGWAGSSWYFLRYMSPDFETGFVDPQAVNYWQNVDLYLGGSEHATGHLLYSRFWNNFLYDIGLVPVKEPFKKLINQGMILGTSAFVYRVVGTNKFVSYGIKDKYDTTSLHVDVCFVENGVLDIEKFKSWREEYKSAEFELEGGKYICGSEVEKMSKSKYNVVNPDDVIDKYGADTLRLYEMFLGPLEQSKPWKTEGITGVYNFLKKFFRLYENISDDIVTTSELKILHKTIKKINDDIENFSFNTSVSAMMIALNELTALKCSKRTILEPLSILISPFAPHIAEELWRILGNNPSISTAPFPVLEEKYLLESDFDYPVMITGKLRFKANFSLDLEPSDIESLIRRDERLELSLNGKEIKKVIVVKNKIINIVT